MDRQSKPARWQLYRPHEQIHVKNEFIHMETERTIAKGLGQVPSDWPTLPGMASGIRINHPKPAQHFSLQNIYPHVSPNRRVTPLASTNGSNLVLPLRQGGGSREAIWGRGTV